MSAEYIFILLSARVGANNKLTENYIVVNQYLWMNVRRGKKPTLLYQVGPKKFKMYEMFLDMFRKWAN